MGAADQGPAAERLLRQCAAGCDGSRFAGFLRRVFRDHGRASLRLFGCRRYLEANCAGSAGRALGRGADTAMIRVELPQHLRTLAHIDGEVRLQIEGPATQAAVLDALEARYPMLCGTIRDHVT